MSGAKYCRCRRSCGLKKEALCSPLLRFPEPQSLPCLLKPQRQRSANNPPLPGRNHRDRNPLYTPPLYTLPPHPRPPHTQPTVLPGSCSPRNNPATLKRCSLQSRRSLRASDSASENKVQPFSKALHSSSSSYYVPPVLSFLELYARAAGSCQLAIHCKIRRISP